MTIHNVNINVVPIQDVYLFTTPVPANAELVVAAAPAVVNCSVDVLAVDIVAVDTLVTDGSNDVLVSTLIHWDKSGAAGTTIFTGAAAGRGDLKTAVLDLNVVSPLWSGKLRLDAGDTLRAVLATTTPDAAGIGYSFIVASRVAEWNGL